MVAAVFGIVQVSFVVNVVNNLFSLDDMKRTQSTKWTALVLPLKPSQNLSSSLNKRNGTIEISRKNSRTCSQISLRCLKRQIKIIRSVKLLELKVLLAIYSHEAVIISKITNMMKVLIIKWIKWKKQKICRRCLINSWSSNLRNSGKCSKIYKKINIL